MQKLLWTGLGLLLVGCGTGGMSARSAGTKVTVEIPSPVVSTPASNVFLYRPSASANKVYISSVSLSSGAISEHGAFSTGAGSGPADFVATPDARFAYVAHSGASAIAQYSLDPANGSLAFVNSYATYAGPAHLAMDPAGRFLFAIHSSLGQLKAYAIDPSSGTLTLVNYYASNGSGARAITVDPGGKFLYAATDQFLQAYSIDQSTGALTAQGAPYAYDVGALAANPSSSRLYYAEWLFSSMGSYVINAVTGALTSGGNYGSQTGYHYKAITFNAAGTHFYAANSYGNQVEAFSVNAGTGNLSFLGSQPVPSGCNAMGAKVAPNQNFLYLACSNSSGKTLAFPINPNGTLGVVTATSIASGMAAHGLTVVEF